LEKKSKYEEHLCKIIWEGNTFIHTFQKGEWEKM